MKKILKIGSALVVGMFTLVLVLGFLSMDDGGSYISDSEEGSKTTSGSPEPKTSPDVVLLCKRSNDSDAVIVTLFQTQADVIYFSRNKVFIDGSAINLPLVKTDFSIKISHPYFDKAFTLNRTSLEVTISKATVSILTGADDSVFRKYACSIDSTEAYARAIEEYSSSIRQRDAGEQRELDELKAKRKI